MLVLSLTYTDIPCLKEWEKLMLAWRKRIKFWSFDVIQFVMADNLQA